MKISVNDQELFTISETQEKVIKYYINSDIYENDMKRRITWVINEIHKEAFKRLKAEWEPKLAAKGIESLPTNKDAFAQLVFSQPEYKDRSARDVVLGPKE